MLLALEGATVRFGGRAVLDAVDLEVAEHEIVCVLGPSGSGKSTLLRAVAGLQPLEVGRVSLDGRDQAGVPAHRRGVGLMFQDHQLFPQRDVGGNVAFGLRMHGVSKRQRAEHVQELLDLVGLPGAARRAVAALSGGEQQRVALARALAPSPKLLMLDEPLGQLDRSLRERLVVELRQLFGRLGTTVLAVTHDQGEAFALADRVVVMRDGRIAQSGTPLQVWQRLYRRVRGPLPRLRERRRGDGGRGGRGHAVGQGAGAGGCPAGHADPPGAAHAAYAWCPPTRVCAVR